DWYSEKNALPVVGWIGGKGPTRHRLHIDYSNRLLFFLAGAKPGAPAPRPGGLPLRAARGRDILGPVATPDGPPPRGGVEPGDRLIRVGDLDVTGKTKGAVFGALHGAPGETRALVLERGDRRIVVDATVTAF